MYAHQIMARKVPSTTPDSTILDAANIMLRHHVSGLPVVDRDGAIAGIVTEGDFLHRSEIGTERKRNWLMTFILGPGKWAEDYVSEHGRKVSEIMTRAPVTVAEDAPLTTLVELMEKNNVKRLPEIRDGKLVGIITRSNLLRTVASLARDVPDPTENDDQIRQRILDEIERNAWCPLGLSVIVRDGIVHLSGAHEIPDPTADDYHIRDRIVRQIDGDRPQRRCPSAWHRHQRPCA
ncbi:MULTISPECIES: CBS domain-containing protein [Bradyrhizobium]|jgi:CBS domain-containing protein|uniref:CBS domain-containing protein n=1 Tax=Bradyrhizobium TaxID=374 RepID=UPI000489BB4F|nr:MULTISPECIES: CBS domain-containing protein [Bradyrhizobium]MCP1925688.1 CBS domain-containing protein [Bradyrhizobium elkanii]MCS3451325.1 CBS domain-containing protein [Bradyrhizobium elkanii]MCS3476820.1 CBS domain-containing protein [Bradyrhizobium elkanii]MCS3476996.1 CBS domain-containing protein [Bradyrhizobium elkanii]MCS3566650.1 CBS domain-containing protein [Bradyrhizobium elkanii]